MSRVLSILLVRETGTPFRVIVKQAKRTKARSWRTAYEDGLTDFRAVLVGGTIFRAAVLVGAFLLFPKTSFAKDGLEEKPSDGTSDQPGGCPIVCTASEACIGNRCVETCRVGCRQGTFCTPSGGCEPLPQPQVPVLTETERQRLAGEASADSTSVLFADFGGIVGFGLALGLEHGRETSFLARVRFLNTGLMSHAVFSENEFQRFDWGFGGNFGVRRYEPFWGNMRGFYYGGGLDYAAIRVDDRVRADASQMLHSVAPFGEFGYRWVFGSFAIGFGPTIGLRYPVGTGFFSGNNMRCVDRERCGDAERRRFEGVLHLEIGWFQ